MCAVRKTAQSFLPCNPHGRFLPGDGFACLEIHHGYIMIQIDMQAGKNGQTLHVGGIKEVGIVVLQKIIHSIADFVL